MQYSPASKGGIMHINIVLGHFLDIFLDATKNNNNNNNQIAGIVAK